MSQIQATKWASWNELKPLVGLRFRGGKMLPH